VEANIGLEWNAQNGELRLASDVEAITSVLGHPDRAVPFRVYCAGMAAAG
jgi:hypothetical protein